MQANKDVVFEDDVTVERLIALVKEKPILYEKARGGYKNVAAKFRVWLEISEKLSASVDAWQRKWKALRDRYTKEMRKRNMPSGSAAPQTETWCFMQQMAFIDGSIKPRATRTNVGPIPESYAINDETEDMLINDETTNAMDESSVTVTSFDDGPVDTTPRNEFSRRKPRESPLESTISSTMKCFTEYIQSRNRTSGSENTTESSDEQFMRGVLAIMSTLKPHNRLRGRRNILQMLTELQQAEVDEALIEEDAV